MSYWIAIDGGATHCTGGLYDPEGACLAEAEGPPCNPTAYGADASARALVYTARALLPALPEGEALGVIAAVAGIELGKHDAVLAGALASATGATELRIAGDLQPVLIANAPSGPAILVVAGTGSNVLAQDAQGNLLQVGGHGAILSDDGSAYRIGAEALRCACDAVDDLGPHTLLSEMIPQALGLDEFFDLIAWTAQAGKADIAALSSVISEAADKGDGAAKRIIEHQALRLVAHVQVACRKLTLDASTPVFLQGGLFRGCPRFHEIFVDGLKSICGLHPTPATYAGHEAVYRLARLEEMPPWMIRHANAAPCAKSASALPPTEAAQEDGPALDTLSPSALVQAMLDAEAETLPALRSQAPALAAAVSKIAEALAQGGRLLYVGAGTSGRLGVLDASECPPTFGTSPEQVLGIIAGGEAALLSSVEGAEDDEAAAYATMDSHEVGEDDVVVGIAASGRTPYTRAALDRARERGAATVLLCCNPEVVDGAHIVIALPTGPEALPGSTRLKAGTATKIALNILSTGAMAQTGRIYQGRMTSMVPVNDKLRARAVRMVAEVAGCPPEDARATLEKSAWSIPAALLMRQGKLDAQTAQAHLAAHRGNLRDALQHAPNPRS